jgi:hypothetical protein
MPVHDWSRVDAGTYHAFHLAWLGQLQAALNGGVLPPDFYALAEQHAGAAIPDMLTLHAAGPGNGFHLPAGRVATVTKSRPRVERKLSARAAPRQRRRTLAVRHVSGHRIVALVEVASPSNKDRRRSVTELVNKLVAALQIGVHALLVDLLAPGPHDPEGLHAALWQRFDPDDLYELPRGRTATLAAYAAASPVRAYIDHLAVGDPLPEMPLFLNPDRYVNVPLGPTYDAAYAGLPEFWREVIEGRREAV